MSKADEKPTISIRWVDEPSDEALASTDLNPALVRLIHHLRELTDAWVETGSIPDGPPIWAHEVAAWGEKISGDVRAHLKHLTTNGEAGTATRDKSDTWRKVVPYFRSRAAMQLAKRALAATGLTASEVVSAILTNKEPADLDDADTYTPWTRVFIWVAHHFSESGMEEGFVALDVSYLVLAFRKLEEQEAEARRIETEQRAMDAEQRAAQAEQRASAAEQALAIQVTRPLAELPTGALHAYMARARKTLQRTRRLKGRGVAISAEQTKILREFESAKLETLNHHELYVLIGLATIAKDAGLLETHPWAMMPKATESEPGRVRVPFPGYSEIARVLRFKEDKDGRIPKAVRQGLEDAINRLCEEERFIVSRILVQSPNGKGTHITEAIARDRWIVKQIVPDTGDVFLLLHPATIATALRSYQSVPDLPAQHQAAKEKLGLRELRPDHIAADLYMRQLQLGTWGSHRSKMRRLAKKDVTLPPMDGVSTVKSVSHATMLETLNLVAYAKKNGKARGVERVVEDLRFAVEMGTLLSFEANGANWDLVLPDPDASVETAIQLPLLDEQDAEEENPELSHA